MPLELGNEPVSLEVNLSPNADFVTGFDSLDGDWPDGARIELVFGNGVTWEATLDGPAANWQVPAAAVNAMIAAFNVKSSNRQVRLNYHHGGSVLAWASGTAQVKK